MEQTRVRRESEGKWTQGKPNPFWQQDLEGRGYRMAYNYLGVCVRRFVRFHRQCLGEIEEGSAKLSKDQMQLIQDNTHKFLQKYISKLLKDPLCRNSNISKIINNYRENYQETLNLKQLQNQSQYKKQPTNNQQIQPNKPQRPDNLESSPSKIFTKSHHRPFSSITVKKNTIQFIPISSNRKWLNREKTNSSMLLYKSQRGLNRNQFTNRHQHSSDKHGNSGLIIQNQTVYIKEGKKKERGYSFKPFTATYSKTSKNNSRNIREVYAGLIEQKQKEQIQSKIYMINCVLAVNLTTPQGYKPRSQCRRRQLC